MTPADIIVERLEHTARQVLDTVTGCACGTRSEHDQLPAGERFISNTDLAEDGPVTAEYAPHMVNVYREVRA